MSMNYKKDHKKGQKYYLLSRSVNMRNVRSHFNLRATRKSISPARRMPKRADSSFRDAK